MGNGRKVTHEMYGSLYRGTMNSWRFFSLMIPIVLVGILVSGCSVNKMAVNKLGDALSSGGSVFASDIANRRCQCRLGEVPQVGILRADHKYGVLKKTESNA